MALRSFADGRLFGERIGNGEPRVLALHGWGRTHRDFADLLQGMDAVALDLPGFGASPAPERAAEPPGAAAYAAILADALPELGGPFVVLGHSFGGRVAVHLAASRPEAVTALVLTGVPLLRRDDERRAPPIGYRIVRALHRRGLVGDARMERLRRRRGSEDYRNASGVMRDVLVRVVNETYEAPLRAVSCPVELVWGDDDPQVPLAVAERAAAILGDRARLTVVPGAGHDTPRTAVAALRVAIERHRPLAVEFAT
ncbi:MAG: alpha/beta hydrolase [Chloroflexi bacterium]|nr:alpha/beta hydrolase [Chloroflexota bacterium]